MRLTAREAKRANQPCPLCGKVEWWLIGRRINGKHTLMCFECAGKIEADRRNRMKGYLKHRDEVFARDGHKCRQCGETKNLTVDHIIPIAAGGTSDLSNLQTLCKRCNVKKSDK